VAGAGTDRLLFENGRYGQPPHEEIDIARASLSRIEIPGNGVQPGVGDLRDDCFD
jgi:hypothetical protein